MKNRQIVNISQKLRFLALFPLGGPKWSKMANFDQNLVNFDQNLANFCKIFKNFQKL